MNPYNIWVIRYESYNILCNKTADAWKYWPWWRWHDIFYKNVSARTDEPKAHIHWWVIFVHLYHANRVQMYKYKSWITNMMGQVVQVMSDLTISAHPTLKASNGENNHISNTDHPYQWDEQYICRPQSVAVFRWTCWCF